jgi:hypothetical protein
MIIVEAGENVEEFDEATRFSTDESNNLCLWAGDQGDELIQIFNATSWRAAGVDCG